MALGWDEEHTATHSTAGCQRYINRRHRGQVHAGTHGIVAKDTERNTVVAVDFWQGCDWGWNGLQARVSLSGAAFALPS